MNQTSAQTIVLLGAIAGALIAGFFSFLNLVMSKEQKVSEFRQQWIDAFRLELSELTAALFHIKYYLELCQFDNSRGAIEKQQTVASTLRESHETYSRCVTSLLLRINSSETDPAAAKINSDFLATFKDLREAFNKANFTKAAELCTPLREDASHVLKAEWERVKRGEQTYRVSKWAAVAILLLGFVGTGVVAVKWFEDPAHLSAPKVPGAPSKNPSQPSQ